MTATTPTTTEIDSANWGLMDMGGGQLDDMDLDFATLFDPALEEANMKKEGSGWPGTTAPAPTVAADVATSAAATAAAVAPTALSTMQQQLKPAPSAATSNPTTTGV